MKKIKTLVCTFFISWILLFSSLANANEIYGGIKGGVMTSRWSGIDEAINLGFYMGTTFTGYTSSAELEVTGTVSEGDVNFINGEWDVTTIAAYYVYRSLNTTYLKLKVGWLYEDVTITNNFLNESGSDSGLSVGMGVGFEVNRGKAIEVEATYIEEDITFISVGYLF